jgi:predicted GIY-YIG superfamily endonuclease
MELLMRIGYIYKITSPSTDKVYVGSTFKNINTRFKEHCNQSKYVTSWEIVKHKDATIELVDSCECVGISDLVALEKEWIVKTENTVNIKLAKDLNL